MLHLLLTAASIPCAAPPLDVIVFDSGGVVTIDQNDVQPDDDIVVRGGPPNMSNVTVLYVTDATVVRSITAEQGGSPCVKDSSQVHGDVTVANGGGCHLGDAAMVTGCYRIQSGGGASSGSSGTLGSLVVEPGGELNGLGGVTVLGDASIAGTAYVSTATIQGTTTFQGSRAYSAFGTSFEGPVHLAAGANVDFRDVNCQGVVRLTDRSQGRFHGSAVQGDLLVEDMGRARFVAGNTLSGVMDLRDLSAVAVVGLTANYPDGAVQDPSGIVTGTDLNGAPISLPFVRESSAELVVAIDFGSIGTTFCTQPFPNSLGVFAHLTATGSDWAAASYLELAVSNLPANSFGFFLVGTAPGLTVSIAGHVCVGGNIGRFVGPGQIMSSGSSGSYALLIEGPFPGNPATTVTPGSTYVFQSWNREPFLNPPGNSRLSDAVSILFR